MLHSSCGCFLPSLYIARAVWTTLAQCNLLLFCEQLLCLWAGDRDLKFITEQLFQILFVEFFLLVLYLVVDLVWSEFSFDFLMAKISCS